MGNKHRKGALNKNTLTRQICMTLQEALRLLLSKETRLLQTIERLRVNAKAEARDAAAHGSLGTMAAPRTWELRNGGKVRVCLWLFTCLRPNPMRMCLETRAVHLQHPPPQLNCQFACARKPTLPAHTHHQVLVHTPESTHAAELQALYRGLVLPGLPIDERLDLLLHVKWAAQGHARAHKAAAEVVVLADREADLLGRCARVCVCVWGGVRVRQRMRVCTTCASA